jgi:hypothetical protein
MDEPSQMLSGSHRKFRHDPNITPLETKKMFGENADNACLDHIFLDKATSREKEIRRKENNMGGKNTSIRLGNTLDELIDQYTAFTGLSRSDVMRQTLSEGLFHKTKFAQFQHFEEWIGQREAFTLLTKCEKCGSEKCLGFFHIDGNIDNISTNNIVTLCIPCINAFQSWKLNQNGIEKFIEWFFA